MEYKGSIENMKVSIVEHEVNIKIKITRTIMR